MTKHDGAMALGPDDLRKKAMQVAAARLDSTPSADEFCELLEELIDIAFASGHQRGYERGLVATIKDAGPAPAQIDPVSAPAGAPAGAGQRELPDNPDANPHRRAGKRLTYDDRVRIRQRYQAALAGKQRMPRGIVQALAAEFNCSEWTIINIGRGN